MTDAFKLIQAEFNSTKNVDTATKRASFIKKWLKKSPVDLFVLLDCCVNCWIADNKKVVSHKTSTCPKQPFLNCTTC